MRARDKAIINDLYRFRCMSRDDIADIHFGDMRNPTKEANVVLKRLRRDGHIDANTQMQPYVYFAADSKIKRSSQKIAHFLGIVGFYRELIRYEAPTVFDIEPKLGDKGTPEPDTFTIWKGTPFFIEIQRSQYSERIMSEKITRYERYYYEEEWRYASWQPKDRPPVFPYIWIISEVNYRLASSCLRFVQSKSVAELIERTETPQYKAVR
ncbi:hypothetical protein [Aneurinibacillus aneurinilyticus]|uniref:hypothetical protein n=1 Tax=Aneurinibacillus aneurinilyticus TaxID=1391 RepID=UPI0023F04807|nr:hypothetical protein [Aneurinibacillus aneurinilyticus]